MHDILQCYERVKQLKGDLFEGAFIAIKAEDTSGKTNLSSESLLALPNIQNKPCSLPHPDFSVKITSKYLSEHLRLVIKTLIYHSFSISLIRLCFL